MSESKAPQPPQPPFGTPYSNSQVPTPDMPVSPDIPAVTSPSQLQTVSTNSPDTADVTSPSQLQTVSMKESPIDPNVKSSPSLQPLTKPTNILEKKEIKKRVSYLKEMPNVLVKMDSTKSDHQNFSKDSVPPCKLDVPEGLTDSLIPSDKALIRLWVVVIMTLVLCTALMVAAHLTHSLTLRVEAYHSLYNLFSLAGSLLSLKVSPIYFILSQLPVNDEK